MNAAEHAGEARDCLAAARRLKVQVGTGSDGYRGLVAEAQVEASLALYEQGRES